jgi:hypothetical protein
VVVRKPKERTSGAAGRRTKERTSGRKLNGRKLNRRKLKRRKLKRRKLKRKKTKRLIKNQKEIKKPLLDDEALPTDWVEVEGEFGETM